LDAVLRSLVLIRVASFDDALARRPAERTVFKAGRQVAGPARAWSPLLISGKWRPPGPAGPGSSARAG